LATSPLLQIQINQDFSIQASKKECSHWPLGVGHKRSSPDLADGEVSAVEQFALGNRIIFRRVTFVR
jgi:hypothetical protein